MANGSGTGVTGMSRIKLVARDIMTRNVQTVSAESSLSEAVAILDLGGFSQVPIMRGGKLVALLTGADVRRALMQRRQDLPVGQLAGPLPELVRPDTRVARVLQAMDDQNVLLVVAEGGQLEGIITYWDMIVLGRPHVMVKEVEQLLRLVVIDRSERKWGADWWSKLPRTLREKAEEEHRYYDKNGPTDSEHMLSHTTFYGLNQIFEHVYPAITEQRKQELDEIRVFRNEISHLVAIPLAEQTKMSRLCVAVGDWLESLLPEDGLG
jgi:CBS domain-containing protein